MPKLSIVTPSYNSAKFLPLLLESVRRQTFGDWEHIIVDDGSEDESATIAKNYAAVDSRINVVQQENRGALNARNEGYRHVDSTSSYIYFLDADDVLEDGMLGTMITYLERHPEVGLAFCDYRCVDENGEAVPCGDKRRYVPTRFWVRALKETEPLTPFVSVYCWAPVMESISILRRSVYEGTSGWDASLGQHGEGVDLFLQIALISELHFVPKCLYQYRRHPSQSSARSHVWLPQKQKVRDKWDHLPWLTDEQRQIVIAAKAFGDGRLALYHRLSSARSEWERGAYRVSLRIFCGALVRLGYGVIRDWWMSCKVKGAATTSPAVR